MYNEIKKIPKRKKIELIIIIFLLIWFIFFLIDYSRYTKGKNPVFAIHHKVKYEDGYVDEYLGIGYIYRSYSRNSIQGEEFGPFWKPRQFAKSVTDIPNTYKDYNVPDNPRMADEYRSLIYYYDYRAKLIGTYKCLNSTSDCHKATGGYDKYDIYSSDPLNLRDYSIKFKDAYEKYAFIDDSKNQSAKYGDEAYERIIYLFDIKNNKIIARYEDIKVSTYDPLYKTAIGENYKYIVKDYKTHNWGIIHLSEEGVIEQYLPFEYDSINYDEDTKTYILSKDGQWYLYNLFKREKVSADFSNTIYDTWENDNKTTYVKTGITKEVGKEKYIEYKIYRYDGNQFLITDGITQVMARGKYVMYIDRNTKKMIFMDYTKAIKKTYNLYFTEMISSNTIKPAVEITYDKDNTLVFYIYKSKDKNSKYDKYTLNTAFWKDKQL